MFKYYITRASETYYENKLIGFAIEWDENSYELNYEDQEINKITIHKTDQCSFFQPEFNKEEIEKSVKKADLPLGVSFHLKNKNSIHLMGDEIENYTISITANN